MKQEFVTTWSRFPRIKSFVVSPLSYEEAKNFILSVPQFISYGCGRSYGDAPLGSYILKTNRLKFFLDFNEHTGELTAESGVTLEEIIKHFLPRGWFLPVTPGTKFVSLGGAVAADVHGKNHHLDGSFSNWVTGIWLLLPNGEEIFCSPNTNKEWFQMTCGGMGLTGLITRVRLRLRRVKSAYIKETIIKCSNLDESLYAFEEYANQTYSVAWLDCSARGKFFGRSLLMLGDHDEEELLNFVSSSSYNLPFDFPSFVLNPYSIKIFNDLFYSKEKKNLSSRRILYEYFFYPLDMINNWNRLYGRNGLLQYQFVIPKDESRQAIKEILKTIDDYSEAPFLTVLKLLGKGNGFPLSFPQEGYTLALDFKLTPRIFSLFRILDQIVYYYGGRIYLAKDARLCSYWIKKFYPNIGDFITLREKTGLNSKINSFLSLRLEI